MQRQFGNTLSTECSICLEEFRDPRILPCRHTFCAQCLQLLIGESRLNLLNPRCRCPLCREVLAVPPGGAQGFPSDVLMVNTLTNRRVMRHDWSSWTPEREVTSGGSNQTQTSNATSGSRVIAYTIVVFVILYLFKDVFENFVSSPNQTTKEVYIIPTLSGHLTMTQLHNELFIINPDTSQGEIRDRATLKQKGYWNVTGVYGIARNSFCMKHKYLYVSMTSQTILKFDADGEIVAKWSTENVKGRPLLTSDCNVAFIPHDGTARIFLYTAYGDLIHKIKLKMDIGGARLNCGVQLPSGQFVVSYGTDADTQHGLSLTDSKGNVLKSFGGKKGNSTKQVNGPYDLLVQESGSVLVVDHNNHRILLLNFDLEYLNEFLSAKSGVLFPHGVLFDQLHRRLFVMGSTWNETTSIVSPGQIIAYDI